MSKTKMNTVGLKLAASALAASFLVGCASQAPAPVRQTGEEPPATATMAGQEPQMPQIHVVRPGETLMAVSRIYNVTVDNLVVWNNIRNPNQLAVGQRLQVSEGGGTSPTVITQPVEIQPIASNDTVEEAPRVTEPSGGREPYSDQAWAAVSPEVLPSSTLPRPGTSPDAALDADWLWPASGELISGFDEASNKGIGIAGNPGDPVIASADGSVVYSGSGLRGYGKLVIIKHDDDYLTAYAHNQALLVQEGESVSKGQRIAELGSTDADRPKLHFEIRRQGRPVDPMQYLPER